MTRPSEYSAIGDVVKLLADDGFDALGEAIRRIINEAMRLERQNHLGVGPYERSEARRGYANGYKPKTVQTRVGALDLDVPQVRDRSFYPSSLEKGLRSERALKVALAEMYVQGVSTRKVAKITEQLCGFEVTSAQVSRAAKELDEVLEQWRNRPLGAFPFVFFDGGGEPFEIATDTTAEGLHRGRLHPTEIPFREATHDAPGVAGRFMNKPLQFTGQDNFHRGGTSLTCV